MTTVKILVLGIFAVLMVMLLTAMITMIAPYLGAIIVVVIFTWLITRGGDPPDKLPDREPP